MKKNKDDLEKKHFEDLLNELEKIVSQLESGTLPLEQSLEHFEDGVRIYKECKSVLEMAEKKISKLSKSLKEEKLEQ
jgi:exodeoxyribonuclease VII small subunit